MIIALTGLKQSGKSTVAKHLQDKWKYTRLNFKDKLIEELKNNFPDLLNEIATTFGFFEVRHKDEPNAMIVCNWDKLFEEKPPLIRKLLQNYGTDVRRKDDVNYWVKKWIRSYDLLTFDADVVVDDCRFLNEAGAIKAHGGIIIRVIRNGQESVDQHQSEMEMQYIVPDYIVAADFGDHEMLISQVDKILNNVL